MSPLNKARRQPGELREVFPGLPWDRAHPSQRGEGSGRGCARVTGQPHAGPGLAAASCCSCPHVSCRQHRERWKLSLSWQFLCFSASSELRRL